MATTTILLTRDKMATVDVCDYHFLQQWAWCAVKKRTVWYAARGLADGTTIFMHRQIAERAGILARCIDHIDRNGLNNCRSNLRPATQSQNIANGGMWRSNTSGFRGVVYDKSRRLWKAQLKHRKHTEYLGRFSTPEEAASAYNARARELFGEFAFVNPLPTGTTA